MLTYTTLEFKGTIKSDYLEEEIHNLMDYTFEIPKSYTYNVFEVTEEYVARPDLISYDAYGDDMFADVICKLNGISNPFELNIGMNLIIPSPTDIMNFTLRPSDKDKDENWFNMGANKSIKTKNSKRQANEAIVGDVRFKIDKASKIIIY
jgi:hypothetical protein